MIERPHMPLKSRRLEKVQRKALTSSFANPEESKTEIKLPDEGVQKED